MKKSIKYAGIAAATLLAVAPVAAPVVSTVSETTVKADDTAYTAYTDATAANAWLNQFADKTYNAGVHFQKFGLRVGNNLPLTASDVANDPLIEQAKVSTVNSDNNFGSAAKITSVQAYAIDADGNVDSSPMSQSDVNTRLSNRLGGGVQVQLGYSYKTSADAAATTGTKTINFKYAKTSATPSVTKAAATYTTPISVAAGSKAANTQLQSSLNVSLKDQNGKELVGNTNEVASVTPDTSYFKTLKTAEGSSNKADATLGAGNTFNANTTYYQRITVASTKDSALDKYLTAQSNSADGSYTINGVSYANTNNGYITAGDTNNGAKVTFVRAINAGSTEAASWTTTDTTGVVTTKTAHEYYTLNNDDNNIIANFVLGANTPWKTDKVRTNANGDKQYRVATGAWIDADNVVYSNGNNNSNNGSGLTDIKTVSGVATLTKAKGYYMALFNNEGKAYDNKYLGSPSAWRVDRTAKGADGNTYYRVATNEWLQAGEGVSFK